jgi:hypothetical protein
VLPGNTDDFHTSLNKININACMILWEFRYYDTELLPTDMYPGLFTTTGCSYVCKADGVSLCQVDGYSYDSNCNLCTGCGNYGCVSEATVPDTCITSACPPDTITDTTCVACYANSVANAGQTGCECSAGYLSTSTTPLVCTLCSSMTLLDVANADACPSCFGNSEESGGITCVCSAGYYEVAPTLTCTVCTGASLASLASAAACSTCIPDAVVSGATCACAAGYYDTDTSSALACASKAKSACSGASLVALSAVAQCSVCVADAVEGSLQCECAAGFIDTDSSPGGLSCACKAKAACASAPLSIIAAASRCAACYVNSEESGSTCTCKTGFVSTGASTLVCVSKAYTACASASQSDLAMSDRCSQCYPNSYKVGSACLCGSGFYNAEPSLLTCTGQS